MLNSNYKKYFNSVITERGKPEMNKIKTGKEINMFISALVNCKSRGKLN